MGVSLPMAAPSATAGAAVTAYGPVNAPASTLAGVAAAVALPMALPSLAARPNLPAFFTSLLDLYLTGASCPPGFVYPLAGQRGYHARTLLP